MVCSKEVIEKPQEEALRMLPTYYVAVVLMILLLLMSKYPMENRIVVRMIQLTLVKLEPTTASLVSGQFARG